MSKELLEAVKLFISQPLNNALSRGQIMEVARIALPILEQEERGEDEWIDWGGGDMPVAKGSLVDLRYRNGEELFGIPAGEANNNSSEPDAHQAYWDNNGLGLDIIAYRIIPERATNQNGEQ